MDGERDVGTVYCDQPPVAGDETSAYTLPDQLQNDGSFAAKDSFSSSKGKKIGSAIRDTFRFSLSRKESSRKSLESLSAKSSTASLEPTPISEQDLSNIAEPINVIRIFAGILLALHCRKRRLEGNFQNCGCH